MRAAAKQGNDVNRVAWPVKPHPHKWCCLAFLRQGTGVPLAPMLPLCIDIMQDGKERVMQRQRCLARPRNAHPALPYHPPTCQSTLVAASCGSFHSECHHCLPVPMLPLSAAVPAGAALAPSLRRSTLPEMYD